MKIKSLRSAREGFTEAPISNSLFYPKTNKTKQKSARMGSESRERARYLGHLKVQDQGRDIVKNGGALG